MALRSLYWRLRRTPSIGDRVWREALARTPCADALETPDRVRLRRLAEQFLGRKRFEGAAGFHPDERVRGIVAVKACLPILHLGLDYYDPWVEIVMYPGDFRVHEEYMDDAGVVHHEPRELCGQSLSQGPMVLGWAAIEEEAELIDRDLVIHECAHKLDVLNGPADGFPPLHADMAPRRWTETFAAAYEQLGRDVDAGIETEIDPYGATDPAEFFAVASETFFTAPDVLVNAYPGVYGELARLYRLDPHTLMERARR